MTRAWIGIDLGGTKTHIGIAPLDDGGHAPLSLTAERVVPTPRAGGAELCEVIGATIDELMRQTQTDRLIGIGIGGAGVPQADGGFTAAPNLGDTAFDFGSALSSRFEAPVEIDNDANVAALGELVALGDEQASFGYVAVGTGIGMGLILEGRLIRGASLAAGEIGYIPVGADPLDAANHRRGALEEAVAGDVLAARDPGASTVREIFERAAAGVPEAREALDAQARWVAYALATVIAVVDPGAFVLGGGIGSREELRAPIQHWLERLGHPDVPVRISTLGSAGAVLGAIELARRSPSVSMPTGAHQ
ncbi:ROK family protein [Microbacterium esteraromaticum]|uniref:ROK family protein n=1 Tax=Microbacterium esteraromaticum TaxID=57043 RepID=UPI0023683B24|nr:ROK family protein [Microbacterium esteraromaticum]WDH79137.1 ROK family protein [Microbacterium esteraromaticum]